MADNFPNPQTCKAVPTPGTGKTSSNYQRSVWGDYFITCTPPVDQKPKHWVERRIEELKEEVRTMFRSTTDNNALLKLVDTIQHLGIGYHFKGEIDDALSYLHAIQFYSEDLHHVALHFRLLRQHGFNVSSDVFLKFKDDCGNFNINEKLSEDVTGLLSLYNAAYLAIPGEKILDEAIRFTRHCLESNIDNLQTPLKKQVLRALKSPLYRMPNRVEARYFIEEYEEDSQSDKVLLEFAKLDFNSVQTVYLQEMRELSMLWRELNLWNKLKLARDRIVECYFWAFGLNFEPEHSRARRFLTIFFALLTLVDDVFDTYGSYHDCKLLNEAIQLWDENAVDRLPLYLRDLYLKFINTINGFGNELEPSEMYRIPYFIKSVQEGVAGFMLEVEWKTKGKVPKHEESRRASLDMYAINQVVCAPLIGVGELTVSEEAFRWLNTPPSIVLDIFGLSRYMNDVVSFQREVEQEKGLNTLQCYMIEHNLTKEEAVQCYELLIEEAWKRVNQACLEPTDQATVPLLQRVVNFARVMEAEHRYFDDGYYNCNNLKEIISLILLKPFTF